jgi:hypothetical protein
MVGELDKFPRFASFMFICYLLVGPYDFDFRPQNRQYNEFVLQCKTVKYPLTSPKLLR